MGRYKLREYKGESNLILHDYPADIEIVSGQATFYYQKSSTGNRVLDKLLVPKYIPLIGVSHVKPGEKLSIRKGLIHKFKQSGKEPLKIKITSCK